MSRKRAVKRNMTVAPETPLTPGSTVHRLVAVVAGAVAKELEAGRSVGEAMAHPPAAVAGRSRRLLGPERKRARGSDVASDACRGRRPSGAGGGCPRQAEFNTPQPPHPHQDNGGASGAGGAGSDSD